MMRLRYSSRLGLLLGLASPLPLAAQPVQLVAVAVPPASTAVDLLVRQAQHWLTLDQADRAASSMERALAAAPSDPAVLTMAVQVEAARNNRASATTYFTRLQAANPTPDQQRAASQALQQSSLDRAGLDEARRLARDGRPDDAVARYRAAFGGNLPPDIYALEYYQTLAATQSGRDQGLQGLSRLADRTGATAAERLARAQALTYSPATRMLGIRLLASMADDQAISAAAQRVWRESLTYYGDDPTVTPLIDAFHRRFPTDTELRAAPAAPPPAAASATVRPDPGDPARRDGYAQLEAGKLDASAAQFQTALAMNPADADALGGLGIVRLRQGRPEDALPLLERAVAADATKAANWQKPLAGAQFGTDLGRAQDATRRGDIAAAEAALRQATQRDVTDKADAFTQLGQLLQRQGNLPEAQEMFRSALADRPNFAPARQGLDQAMRGERVPDEQRQASAAPTAAPAATSSDRLRQDAAGSGDPMVAIALLRNGVAQAPADPWVQLDLARSLKRVGRAAEGRAQMEDLAARLGTPDANYAAALLAQEDGRLADAEAFLGRIPPRARTPDMARFAARLRTARDIAQAATSPDARMALLQIAARPDPTGQTAADVITALGRNADPAGAIAGAEAAARAATAANRTLGPAARLLIASALLGAGDDDLAASMASTVEAGGHLTPAQINDIAQMRVGIAIRAADRLNEAGDQTRAFDKLRPALASNPEDTGVQLALARLYQGAKRPADAQRLTDAVLTRDPSNVEARAAAVDAAIANGDLRRARALSAQARTLTPDDSRVLLLQARVARADGDDTQARVLLEAAAAQRRLELASAGAAPATTRTIAGTGPGVADRLANPFGAPDALPQSDPGTGITDPVGRDIARALAETQKDLASDVTVGAGLRTRSGTAGLDKLAAISAPISASTSAGSLGGRITATVTPMSLDAGHLPTDTASLRRFGSNAGLNTALTATTTSAVGVGLGLAYRRDDSFRVDVGASPIGFLAQNVLGGVEFAPHLGPVTFRIDAERRSVTDSLLSYGGMRDPGTREVWGGVVRDGAHAQFEIPLGAGYVYAGGGYSSFTGRNTASNNRTEAGAGFAYPILKGPDYELRTGVDLVYFAYANNQSGFTLGQGGYFSPQSYTAINLPVDYRATVGDLTYRVGGTAGYARFNANGSPLYPNNPAMQAQAEIAALANSADVATNPAQNRGGFVGGVRLDLDYALSTNWSIGAGLRFDKAADWQETNVSVRLHGWF